MADYLIILLMGVLAFEGAQWWVIPVGAIGLSIGACVQLWQIRTKHPTVPLDGKIYSFFAASIGNSLVVCGASYLVGFIGRAVLV